MNRCLWWAALLVACDSGHKVDTSDGYETVAVIPMTVNRDLDILFMIDDSPSMADKQANLANNFPVFVNALNDSPGGLPNVHIGVVSSDVGTKATQDPTPGPAVGGIGQGGCAGTGDSGNLQINGAPVQGTFISDIKLANGQRQTNYTGDLATVFGTMARLGAGGCGFEQPLEAVRRALNNNVTNAGFLRPSANLLVVLLADEDDCSMSRSVLLGPESAVLGPLQSFRCTRFGVTCSGGGATPDAMNSPGDKFGCQANDTSDHLEKVSTYVSFLRSLKSGNARVGVAALIGPPSPLTVELRSPPGGGAAQSALAHSCTYAGPTGEEVADPGVRIQTFLDGFASSLSRTICERDLSDSLVDIASLAITLGGSACLPAALPEKSDGTYDCIVEDLVNEGLPTQVTTAIGQCKEGAETAPCWKLVPDTQCRLQEKFEVVRSATPPPSSVLRVRCKNDI